jgi:hypothetical protein
MSRMNVEHWNELQKVRLRSLEWRKSFQVRKKVTTELRAVEHAGVVAVGEPYRPSALVVDAGWYRPSR